MGGDSSLEVDRERLQRLFPPGAADPDVAATELFQVTHVLRRGVCVARGRGEARRGAGCYLAAGPGGGLLSFGSSHVAKES
jgi:hypothetical protein